MKVAVLDDWFDTLRTLPCFAKLVGQEVRNCTDHLENESQLVRRLQRTEALVLIRERTASDDGVKLAHHASKRAR